MRERTEETKNGEIHPLRVRAYSESPGKIFSKKKCPIFGRGTSRTLGPAFGEIYLDGENQKGCAVIGQRVRG